MRARIPVAVCFASGIAVGLCFLFPMLGPVIFFCMAPGLAVLLRHRETKKALGLCVIFCLGILMTAYTLAFSIRPNVAEPFVFWIDLGIYAAACVLHGLFLAGGLWCGLRFPCPRPLRWLAVAVFWALAEWLCGAGPLAWPIMQLGLVLRTYPGFIQSAGWGGLLLVSAVIMAVNVLLAEALCCHKARWRLCSLGCAVFVLLGNVWAGMSEPSAAGTEASIAVIQPGLSTVSDDRLHIYETALALAEEAAGERPDIILLPESILPQGSGAEEIIQAHWGSTARKAEADVLVGGGREQRAALYHFAPDGSLADIYQKQREVPIFENGARGKEFRWPPDNEGSQLSLQRGRAGVMICYESMFPVMARQKAAAGAELLIVPTNDSWFESDIAKDIHLAHGIYRAVETGRTLVQAGMDGHTAVVDAKGNRTEILDTRKPGILYAKISFTSQETLWLKWGNTWLFLCLALLSPGMVQAIYKWLRARFKNR